MAIFSAAAATCPPIKGQPTDEDLTTLCKVMHPLLLSIPYDKDGDHNLIGLIKPPNTYAETWGAPFPIPACPPAYPMVADDASAVVRARREAEHAILVKDYATYETAERATAKFIRDMVDEMWYRDLRHDQSLYTTVTAAALLHHLDTNCGGLHPSELVNLPTEMLGYYAIAEGIPEYISMLEKAQRKLARAQLPMSDNQLLAIASTAVLASDHFPRPTDEWEALPRHHKTWTAWKAHYRAAHTARKRQLLAAGTAPHRRGEAHMATPPTPSPLMTPDTHTHLDSYLDAMAATSTTDRTTIVQLIDANAKLTATVAALTESNAKLSATIASLTGATPALRPTPTPAPSTRSSAHRARRPLDPTGYCWTHGYRVQLGHSSATCSNPKEGHKSNATHANTMGGSTANKPTS